ncbi:MAG: trigger factor [Candidatus Pelagibacter sp. TMED153]|nr:MAG: trigger factor [Candidatus Pelagibacter sp. TMED153]|tara:strand:+ start:53 stop:1429 length:1377 start_codon:yes stop_codon:yes gene_type:complete
MKVQEHSKKGLKTTLSVIVDKETIQKKMDERLNELQKEVSLKGFRAGKVPTSVIKSQFGKSIYGEVIDKILRETSSKAIEEKKIKVAGQPKIDLKVFGEGKDLNYELQIDLLPEIKLKSFKEYKATEYKVKIEDKIINDKLNEISNQNKKFEDKTKGDEKAKIGDQVIFDYSATVDGNKFEGSEGKGVQLELGKDLFLKGFDEQLVGVKKNDIKNLNSILPANHPKKELANKKANFECKILNVQEGKKNKIDDEFAKIMGAKDLNDLKKLIENQISSQYLQALNSITKKEILDQIEKNHQLDLPKNLIDQEVLIMTQSLKDEEKKKHKENNEKIAKSRIKLGLLLNEYGEKNNLKVSDDDVKVEIQKQIKGMPGQEKMVLDYYQKNPSATQSLKGSIYEEKIITLIKSNIKLEIKNINTKEAEKIISEFNKPNLDQSIVKKTKFSETNKVKSKKISKK